jgi:nitrogenase delta subunit
MDDIMKDRVDQLVDYIMKWCLWQFNSRAWDRKKQNEEIITKTMQILSDEPVEHETPADKYYWVEAVILARDFKSTYPWVSTLDKIEIKQLMLGLKERIDYLTITGSLNQELTNPLY